MGSGASFAGDGDSVPGVGGESDATTAAFTSAAGSLCGRGGGGGGRGGVGPLVGGDGGLWA